MTMDQNTDSSAGYLAEFQDVAKSYEGKSVLMDFTLSIMEGEFLTLLGPSGCGKTTVLRLLAGFDQPDHGEIRLDGKCIHALPPHHRPVNTVFQHYALFPHMTVAENVAFGLKMKKLQKNAIKMRVEQTLEQVHLTACAHRKPHQLSGGQQQRVALARAIVNQPRIILLDEPLSALDYMLRKEMQYTLKSLQRKWNFTFLFVTHDQEEALSLSDRIAVMYHGTIQQIGSPQDIYETPGNSIVARFVGQSNLLAGTVIRQLGPDILKVNIEGKECELYHPCSSLEIGEAFYLLLRPDDLLLESLSDNPSMQTTLVGTVLETHYKGMTLDTVICLDNGTIVSSTQFYTTNDGVFDYPIGHRVAVRWPLYRRHVVLLDTNRSIV